jgi:hypothetical protein
MPLIRLEYNEPIVQKDEAELLAHALTQIVSKATDIEDVFVYGNHASIQIQTAPIEVFVEMSAYKIKNAKDLSQKIIEGLKLWKIESEFSHPINFTLIPMNWHVEINI